PDLTLSGPLDPRRQVQQRGLAASTPTDDGYPPTLGNPEGSVPQGGKGTAPRLRIDLRNVLERQGRRKGFGVHAAGPSARHSVKARELYRPGPITGKAVYGTGGRPPWTLRFRSPHRAVHLVRRRGHAPLHRAMNAAVSFARIRGAGDEVVAIRVGEAAPLNRQVDRSHQRIAQVLRTWVAVVDDQRNAHALVGLAQIPGTGVAVIAGGIDETTSGDCAVETSPRRTGVRGAEVFVGAGSVIVAIGRVQVTSPAIERLAIQGHQRTTVQPAKEVQGIELVRRRVGPVQHAAVPESRHAREIQVGMEFVRGGL